MKRALILGFKNGLMTRGVLIDLPLMKGVIGGEPQGDVLIVQSSRVQEFKVDFEL